MPTDAKRYSTYLTPAREKQMEQYINRVGEKPSVIVREALTAYLDKNYPTVIKAPEKK